MRQLRLVRFFGFSMSEVDSMCWDDFIENEMAMDRLMAEEGLIDLAKSDYPRASKQYRQDLHKSYKTKALPSSEKKVVTGEDMMRILKNGR